MSGIKDDHRSRIGFIGLGNMGTPMARRLLGAGFVVAVHDAKSELVLAFEGVPNSQSCRSVRDAASQADILITMLPTSAHVRSVLFEGGASDALPPDALVLDMSTSDPEEQVAIADLLARKGKRFVDAPVCRGRREAESGRLIALAGGSEDNVAFVRPVLEALCEAVYHIGDVGFGTRLKLVNNYMSMVHMVLAAEGLSFAAKLGIDRQTAFDVLSRTPAGQGQLLTNFPRKVLAGDITAEFPLALGHKDLSLALKLGSSVGAPLMLGAAARELFALAGPWGRSHQDCTAMLLLIEDIARGKPQETSPRPGKSDTEVTN